MREKAGDKFLLCHGISIYERVHFIRGLENTWMDLYEAPDDATAHKVSLISREQGAVSAESWPALSYDKHLKLMEEVTRGKAVVTPAGKTTT